MLADFLLTAYELRWFLLGCGFIMCTLGVVAIVMHRTELVLGPDPEIPPVQQPRAFTVPSPPAPPNYRRPDSDTGVVPRIPGATPHAGPVCPVCGAAWHGPVCPPPKERTEEMDFAATIAAAEEQLVAAIPPPPGLAPQFAALDRFFKAVDEARADTDQAMHRIVDTLAGRDHDCPLTTQEIPPLEPSTPFYDAAIRNTDTRELSEVMKKVSAP